MKFNKQIAIILALLSLLLSALGAAYYFYNQNKKALVSNNQLRVVFVAAHDIKKNKKIIKSDLKQMKIAKKYVLTTPLLAKEIVNKIAKDNIYKNDMFRKEKLSVKIDDGKKDVMSYKNSSYNMEFSLFKNPNYSLKQGDFISIASVYPESLKRENLNYEVQYVAKNVKVIGFLEKGESVKQCFRMVKRKVKTKKKDAKVKYETVKVFANELVLDIKDSTLLKLIEDYNKGKQLWMVKTKEKKVVQKKKEEILDKKLSKIQTKSTNTNSKVKRVRNYKVQWFIPKDINSIKRATIHYADTNTVLKSAKAIIKDNKTENCNKREKILIGISYNVDLRRVPSSQGKLLRRVHKNYLIPFVKMVNSDWYEVCDGSYVHKNEVTEISLPNAKKKLLWKQKK